MLVDFAFIANNCEDRTKNFKFIFRQFAVQFTEKEMLLKRDEILHTSIVNRYGALFEFKCLSSFFSL